MPTLKRVLVELVAEAQPAQFLPFNGVSLFGVQEGPHQKLGELDFALTSWNLKKCPRGLVVCSQLRRLLLLRALYRFAHHKAPKKGEKLQDISTAGS